MPPEGSFSPPEKAEPQPKGDGKEGHSQLVGMSLEKTHIGPLPSPEDFARYDEVVPGAAERILRQAEKEQDFRHAATRSAQAIEAWKVLLGSVLSLCLIAVAGFAIWLGHPWAAVPFGLAGLITLIFRRLLAPKTGD